MPGLSGGWPRRCLLPLIPIRRRETSRRAPLGSDGRSPRGRPERTPCRERAHLVACPAQTVLEACSRREPEVVRLVTSPRALPTTCEGSRPRPHRPAAGGTKTQRSLSRAAPRYSWRRSRRVLEVCSDLWPPLSPEPPTMLRSQSGELRASAVCGTASCSERFSDGHATTPS